MPAPEACVPMLMNGNTTWNAESALTKLFHRLYPVSRACIEEIARKLEPVRFERGDIVVYQDEPCDVIYFFHTAMLRIGFVKEGREDTVAFGGDGDVFFSVPTFFCNEPSTFSLMALDLSLGWQMSFATYRAMERRFPELTIWMHNLLGVQLYAVQNMYRNAYMTTAMQRFKNFCSRYDINPGAIKSQPLSRINRIIALKYIAQYLGITQQTLSKLRRHRFTD